MVTLARSIEQGHKQLVVPGIVQCGKIRLVKHSLVENLSEDLRRKVVLEGLFKYFEFVVPGLRSSTVVDEI